jgi:hypothetical protein
MRSATIISILVPIAALRRTAHLRPVRKRVLQLRRDLDLPDDGEA